MSNHFRDTTLGYVYKMKADGSEWRIIHTFSHSVPQMGAITPTWGLVSDGVDSLLGITHGNKREGDYGTLYKINATTGVLTTLVQFSGKPDPHLGSFPCAGLATDGMGFYWGSTEAGGTNDTGTVFKFHPATGVLTTVAEFPASPDPRFRSLATRAALVSDGNGSWWGTTYRGGADQCGNIFKVDATTGELMTVVEFIEGAGYVGPTLSLVSDGQGFLWGTCDGGWGGDGRLFKVNVFTGDLTTVVDFTDKGRGNSGHVPDSALVSDGHGFLWGCTYRGGSDDAGTLFKVDIASGALTTLVEFEEKQSRHKGYRPNAALVSGGHGAFLGTTSKGGKKNAGTIFKIDIATGVLTTLVELGKVGP